MSARQDSILKLVIALALISGMASALMAGVYLLTFKPIEAAQRERTNQALREILPAFDNQPGEQTVTLKVGDGLPVTFYTARKDGRIVGFAGAATTPMGFGGDITVMAGLKPDGAIATVLVTRQSETPGLGTVVTDRKRAKTLAGLLAGHRASGRPPNPILDQLDGLRVSPGEPPWKVKKDGGALDGVTGATITSRAVVGAAHTIASTFATHREQLFKENP